MKKVKAWVANHIELVIGGATIAASIGLYFAFKALTESDTDQDVFDLIPYWEYKTPAMFEGRNLTVEEAVAILGMDEYLLQQLEKENLVPADLAANFVLNYIDDVAPQSKDILEPIVFYGK